MFYKRSIPWFWIYLSTFQLFIVSCSDSDTAGQPKVFPTFNLLAPESTGITFSNDITSDVQTGHNVLDFDYFYNGSGVAIADFNNDNKLDILFTGNQVPNRIYKNKGNLQFEDVTPSSGLSKGKVWSNGVSIIDINNDGLEDIYISQGGPYPAEQRQNLLYINTGNFKFEEVAVSYGIADDGMSTQSVFFDFDRDGDKDLFVANETPLYGLDPISFFKMLNKQQALLGHVSSCHLYRNDNNKFTDITESAGVLTPAFALGVVATDLNEDGWIDLYVSNDYYLPDAIYINDKSGGFIDMTKSMTNQVSFYGMGVDVADVNSDGHKDIFVLDMASADHYRAKTLMASMNTANFKLLTEDLGFAHQYMFNSLLTGNGKGVYDNIAHQSKVAKTDWSWAGLVHDFDLDGTQEIFVTNGYRKYSKDNDFQMKVRELKSEYNGEPPIEKKEALYDNIPSEKLSNIYFESDDGMQFSDQSKSHGINQLSFSNGAAYADLDNDGDSDLVVNNMDQSAFIYQNMTMENSQANYVKISSSSNQQNIVARSILNGKTALHENIRVRGYLSSVSDDIIIGLGNNMSIDSLRITIDQKEYLLTDVNAGTTVDVDNLTSTNFKSSKKSFVEKVESEIVFGEIINHKENPYEDFESETLLPYKQSTLGPKISLSPSSTSLILPGSAGQNSKIYDIKNDRIVSIPGALTEDLTGVFLDYDRDGDEDIYIVTGGNEFPASSLQYSDKLLENIDGRYRLRSDLLPANLNTIGSAAVSIDINKDGWEDIFVGGRIEPQKYPVHTDSYILMNNEGVFTHNEKDNYTDLGIVNDIEVLDYNQDGWPDLLLACEWGRIELLENKEGKLVNVTNEVLDADNYGWWFSITLCDYNNDGLKDFIAGNLGTNSKYKASPENPLKVFSNDFDKNGSQDLVLSSKYKGEYVPFRGLECSSEQMPFISDKFESYSSYANASLIDVYGKALEDAVEKKCTNFQSYLYTNTGDGFTKTPLPNEAQLRPILDGIELDINKDGKNDIVLVGNIYNTEVETPRLDYHLSTVLLSDGENLVYNSDYSSDMLIGENSKSVEHLSIKGQSYILIGNNNAPASLFKI